MSKPFKGCTMCGKDISQRHSLTRYCQDCVGKRSYQLLKQRGGLREVNPGQYLALQMVNLAVRHGLLAPVKTKFCVDCGKPAAHYDHRDYNRPLDVEPVCVRCNVRRGPAIPLKPAGDQAAAA